MAFCAPYDDCGCTAVWSVMTSGRGGPKTARELASTTRGRRPPAPGRPRAGNGSRRRSRASPGRRIRLGCCPLTTAARWRRSRRRPPQPTWPTAGSARLPCSRAMRGSPSQGSIGAMSDRTTRSTWASASRADESRRPRNPPPPVMPSDLRVQSPKPSPVVAIASMQLQRRGRVDSLCAA